MPNSNSVPSVKGLPTKRTSKPVYPDRTCKMCANYPCFEGIDKMFTDLAKAGCLDWTNKMVGNK